MKTKILYLECIAGDAARVGDLLKNTGVLCNIYAVKNKPDYVAALSGFAPQLIIADDAVTGFSAIEALAIVREYRANIPLIVFTGSAAGYSTSSIVKIIKLGAFDYILKEHIDTLPGAIVAALNQAASTTKLSLDEQSYKQIVETAQEGIWIIDENLVTTFVNKKVCDMLGYPAEEIIGKRNLDFKDEPGQISTIERTRQRKLGITETHESTFIKRDGEVVYCIVATNGLFDNAGTYLGTLAMLTDITERKVQENALKLSEANLSAIIENTTDLVYSLDRDLKVITYNQLFKTTIKHVYGFDIVTGSSTLALISGFDAEMGEKWKAIYAKALNGETQQFINEYTFGPEKVYLSYSINPIWETEKVIGLSCFSRDITKQKLSEIEREKITADLLQRNKAMEQFTYIISHNLRAPVANIIGLSSLLPGFGADDEDIARVTNSISYSATKLDDIISDLNHVLQIGQMANENIEAIILPQLVDDIKFSIWHLIDKEKVTIQTDFEVEEMNSLKSFIHSIFYNLILNSVKYRKPAVAPIIKISTGATNGRIVIKYCDNGRGIDTSKHGNEIFGLYKRFDTSVEGKGMGLFMVKAQVESLGGSIGINSALNQGTEFVLEFPQ
nr:PAS domain-containing sensor histidine kinase [uncultured Mucilaginibacter sp.]